MFNNLFDETSEAYQAGFEAARNGLSLMDNPYIYSDNLSQNLSIYWVQGYENFLAKGILE